jgi:hypothetical protein
MSMIADNDIDWTSAPDGWSDRSTAGEESAGAGRGEVPVTSDIVDKDDEGGSGVGSGAESSDNSVSIIIAKMMG